MKNQNRLSLILELASDKISLLNSIKVSIIVGVILNLINQGNAVFNFNKISVGKFFLTFLVPFLVSVYSSVSTKLKFYAGEIAPINGRLVCRNCKVNEIDIKKGIKIEECVNCREETRWRIS